MKYFPKIIPIFPLSNFIIFPNTTVPLNIFEPRYLDMVNDSMKSDKLIGMIQPKNSADENGIPKLYDVGCLGKIISFRETEDSRYLIELKGKIRFQIVNEVNTNEKYRSRKKERQKKQFISFCSSSISCRSFWGDTYPLVYT